MGGGLESRCVGRVYSAVGAVHRMFNTAAFLNSPTVTRQWGGDNTRHPNHIHIHDTEK